MSLTLLIKIDDGFLAYTESRRSRPDGFGGVIIESDDEIKYWKIAPSFYIMPLGLMPALNRLKELVKQNSNIAGSANFESQMVQFGIDAMNQLNTEIKNDSQLRSAALAFYTAVYNAGTLEVKCFLFTNKDLIKTVLVPKTIFSPEHLEMIPIVGPVHFDTIYLNNHLEYCPQGSGWPILKDDLDRFLEPYKNGTKQFIFTGQETQDLKDLNRIVLDSYKKIAQQYKDIGGKLRFLAYYKGEKCLSTDYPI